MTRKCAKCPAVFGKILKTANFLIFASISFVDCCLKIFGTILVFCAICLIFLVSYTYFFLVIPALPVSFFSKAVTSVIGSTCAFNILYNYAFACLTNPGNPPEVDMTDLEVGGTTELFKQCLKCSRFKPPRCHHCSVCNRCVLKMDHHCAWINGCVGFHNYRYFMLFLLWLFTGASMYCAFAAVEFYDLLFRPMMMNPRQSHWEKHLIIFGWILCCSMCIAVGVLLGLHTYLIFTNQTTIEFQGNMTLKRQLRVHGQVWRNPYDLGRTANFQQIFGFSRFPLWLMPYWSNRPPGNGLTFPTLGRPI